MTRSQNDGSDDNHMEDSRYIDPDYSIGGGVTMRRPIDHGFRSDNLNDRIRGAMGSRRGEHFGKGPKDWQRTDERLYEEVCEQLSHNHLVDASDIEIKVTDGNVYLRGTVEDRPTKREAERCVEKVLGIRDIFNELKIH